MFCVQFSAVYFSLSIFYSIWLKQIWIKERKTNQNWNFMSSDLGRTKTELETCAEHFEHVCFFSLSLCRTPGAMAGFQQGLVLVGQTEPEVFWGWKGGWMEERISPRRQMESRSYRQNLVWLTLCTSWITWNTLVPLGSQQLLVWIMFRVSQCCCHINSNTLSYKHIFLA